jgi:hypothetical protein
MARGLCSHSRERWASIYSWQAENKFTHRHVPVLCVRHDVPPHDSDVSDSVLSSRRCGTRGTQEFGGHHAPLCSAGFGLRLVALLRDTGPHRGGRRVARVWEEAAEFGGHHTCLSSSAIATSLKCSRGPIRQFGLAVGVAASAANKNRPPVQVPEACRRMLYYSVSDAEGRVGYVPGRPS